MLIGVFLERMREVAQEMKNIDNPFKKRASKTENLAVAQEKW